MSAPVDPGASIVSPARRRGVVFALVLTLAALPLLVWSLEGDDEPTDMVTTTDPEVLVVAPEGRALTGPPKGVSVVTTSTTSSTLPLTTTTTSLPPQP